MSVNSSLPLSQCPDTDTSVFIYMAFIITRSVLLFPLSSLVLYLGLQRWRQQRSFATASHSDVFTYNMAAMELIAILGSTCSMCGLYSGLSAPQEVGLFMFFLVLAGQMFFHVLTCVERYLAVVHPVTYMGLRRSGGVRIRNISVVVVWLLSCVWSATVRISVVNEIQFFCSLVVAIVVVSFCSLRVLCVLIRPGPGEVGGARERVDQSKRRAFHTIMAITAVLWLWFVGLLVSLTLNHLLLVDHVSCLLIICVNFFNLPCSLASPVLFLHRAGKLTCCC